MYPEKMEKIFPVFHVKHDKNRGGRKKGTGAPERRSGPPISAADQELNGCHQIRIMPSSGGTEICR